MHAPVDDARQVELQEALSQRHEGEQARVEEEQEQQAPLHGETVRHGGVLQTANTFFKRPREAQSRRELCLPPVVSRDTVFWQFSMMAELVEAHTVISSRLWRVTMSEICARGSNAKHETGGKAPGPGSAGRTPVGGSEPVTWPTIVIVSCTHQLLPLH